MDFVKVLTSHVMWKTRLQGMIDSNNIDEVHESEVNNDRACELGQWLHENSEQFSSLSLFEEVKSNHYFFHRSAAQVIEFVKTSQPEEANALLKGEYAELSQQLQASVRSLAKEMQAGKK
jgi:hypothetical protein